MTTKFLKHGLLFMNVDHIYDSLQQIYLVHLYNICSEYKLGLKSQRRKSSGSMLIKNKRRCIRIEQLDPLY